MRLQKLNFELLSRKNIEQQGIFTMSNVGKLLKDCRREANPFKIPQKEIAEILQKDISYISKVEKGEIEPNFSGIETEKLTQLFRKNKVSDIKIQEFVDACESSRVTGRGTSDKDSDILKFIYNTLQELEESEKQAYRKELRDRNDVWHGFRQIMTKFQENKASFDTVEDAFQSLEKIEENSVCNIKARLQLESSRVSRYQGKIRVATTKFSHALELAQRAGDEILLADALRERGDFFRRSNQENLLSALEDYERVYEIYNNRSNDTGKANAQVRIVSILLTSGLLQYRNHDAIRLCDESLKYAQVRRDNYLERKSLEYKAWAFSMRGNLDKALRLQQTAHEIAIKTSNDKPKELAKSATYLAGFYLMCGLLDQAEKLYREADNYVKQMFSGSDESGEEKEIFIRALIYLGLGTLKIQRPNERIEARYFLVKSLEYADQSNDSLTLGRVLSQLAQLDLMEGLVSNAEEKFIASETAFKKSGLDGIGNPYYMSNLYFGFTELEYRKKDFSKAAQYLSKIDTLATKFHYGEHLIRLQLWKAALLVVDNIKKNENKIVELCFSALDDAKNIDHYILQKSLNIITLDIERLYREGQQAEVIDIVKKIIKQATQRLAVTYDTESELIETWVGILKSRLSEWDVVSKTLKQKRKTKS